MNTYYFYLVDKESKTTLETARLNANSYDEACIKLHNAYCHPDERINNIKEAKFVNNDCNLIIINFADFGSDVVGIRISEAEAMQSSEIIDIK